MIAPVIYSVLVCPYALPEWLDHLAREMGNWSAHTDTHRKRDHVKVKVKFTILQIRKSNALKEGDNQLY